VRRGEGEKLPDIVWLNAEGKEMLPEDWGSGFGRTIGVFLNGNGIAGLDNRGRRISDVNFLLYFNAHDEAVKFVLPTAEYAQSWEVVINTAGKGVDGVPLSAGETVEIPAKSLSVLRAYTVPEAEPDHSVAASLAVLTQTHNPETTTVSTPAAGR
jgi:glycogen operon protein